uniref:Uncharacterized protein n=1 Tax=Lactuca sativa TaxID=4236 RepID=A0A9R1XIY5_LACSA|nr:hypothetical protein LSAT_V11C400189480 [Lactuca sativa]
MPSSRICRGHWVTSLALSNEVNTSGMFLIPFRDMGANALGNMRVEHRWIMASIARVMRHLGMDHPPFPQTDSVVRPPAQPRGTIHDGVGTFLGIIMMIARRIRRTRKVSMRVASRLGCILILIFTYFVGYIFDTLMHFLVCVCIYMVSVLSFIDFVSSQCIGSITRKHR